jgi:hypothetical protein
MQKKNILIGNLEIFKHFYRYKSWPTRPYVCIAVLPAITYSLSTVISAATTADCTKSVVLCAPPSVFTGNSLVYWVIANIYITVSVVVIYSMTLRKAIKLGAWGKNVGNCFGGKLCGSWGDTYRVLSVYSSCQAVGKYSRNIKLRCR